MLSHVPDDRRLPFGRNVDRVMAIYTGALARAERKLPQLRP
jgi:hypothetical protein